MAGCDVDIDEISAFCLRMLSSEGPRHEERLYN